MIDDKRLTWSEARDLIGEEISPEQLTLLFALLNYGEQCERERDKYKEAFKQFVECVEDDMECEPECDSHRHTETCPAANPGESFRMLRKERDEARKALTAIVDLDCSHHSMTSKYITAVGDMVDIARKALGGL